MGDRARDGEGATLEALLAGAERSIRASRSADLWRPWVARSDAEELAALALGRALDPRALDTPLTAAQRRRLAALVRRRVAGEPIALIRGSIDFRGLRLTVRHGVFTPRLSSEHAVEQAVRRLRGRRAPVLVDLATGAGPVALAVAHEVPTAVVWGLDISPDAVRLAAANARRLALRNVRFRRSDMLAALPARLRGAVDVMTIHPPYVARDEVSTLPREISRYEPLVSLTDRSEDGLGLVRRLAAEAGGWLRPGGWVLVEVGPYLARSVAAVLRHGGLVDVTSRSQGPAAVTRVVAGRTSRRTVRGGPDHLPLQ